jgi:tRNA modification GTPase
MARLPASGDTIAAIATAPGRGGIGVIRLSGPGSERIARLLSGLTPRPRHAHYASLRGTDGEILDRAVLLFYPGPNSFTGEDVVELQCHGSPVLLQAILRQCLERGARQAGPGEFSQRAFLNGKIDLAQAEAIADLISSSTEAAARSAVRSLDGAFSEQVHELLRELIDLRVYVEAAIDFPEEEVDFIGDSDVAERLEVLQARVRDTLARARRGRTLHDGLTLVLAGVPNAGKSSLLNCLSGADSAIVTPIAGTTRDVLREQIDVDGLPLHIVDTAGLRRGGDAVEQEGIRRARREMARADRILLVIDDATTPADAGVTALLDQHREELPIDVPVTLLRNKCDLSGHPPRLEHYGRQACIWLSAHSGAGLDLLRRHLLDCAGLAETGGDFSARERHIVSLEATAAHLQDAEGQLNGAAAAELVAEDLRCAQERLGEITGAFSADDLLGEIFSSFCIGK